jgi:hypothetical protein
LALTNLDCLCPWADAVSFRPNKKAGLIKKI